MEELTKACYLTLLLSLLCIYAAISYVWGTALLAITNCWLCEVPYVQLCEVLHAQVL